MADKQDEKQTRIFLWSWPRSISTAVEKCLSFVDGVQTWHEPYTVVQLLDFVDVLSKEKSVIATTMTQYKETMLNIGKSTNEYSHSKFLPVSLFNSYQYVKSQLEQEEPGKKYILIKDMASAIVDHIDELPNVPARHTFLIRHPHRFLLSQRNMVMRLTNYQGDPAELDVFQASPILSSYFKTDAMYNLWKKVQETGREPKPIIIDAEDIMNHPDKIIPKYLDALGIPFHEKYLTWDESEEILQTWKGALEQVLMGKMSGVFDKAFKSSRFHPHTHPVPKKEDLTPDIMKIADTLVPGYDEMFKHRIKPE